MPRGAEQRRSLPGERVFLHVQHGRGAETTLSHSGVAYSGWLATSRQSRAPFLSSTSLLRAPDTTRRNRSRATSSGDSRRCPRKTQVTPYSLSSPKMRLSTWPSYVSSAPAGNRDPPRYRRPPRKALACLPSFPPLGPQCSRSTAVWSFRRQLRRAPLDGVCRARHHVPKCQKSQISDSALPAGPL